jgi:tetrahydromethanopterin S-methyltransferase subunit G
MSLELLTMYREYNDKRFDEVRKDLQEIQEKLNEIHDFKVQMIANSRLVSMVVSAVCGLVTLIITTIVSIKFK